MWISGSSQVYKVYSTSSNPVIGDFYWNSYFLRSILEKRTRQIEKYHCISITLLLQNAKVKMH